MQPDSESLSPLLQHIMVEYPTSVLFNIVKPHFVVSLGYQANDIEIKNEIVLFEY